MNQRLTTFLAAFAALLAAAGAAEAKPSIAVLGIEVVAGEGGVDEKATKVASALTSGLRQRASLETGPYELAPNSAKDLLEMKLLSDCSDERRDCMAEIGAELGAERLIYGKLEMKGDVYHVSLNLLHVKGQSMERTLADDVPVDDGTEQKLRPWARSFYNRLTGMVDTGTVAVRADVREGTVYIDGEVRGQLSDGRAQIDEVQPGPHSVSLDSDGYEGWEGKIEVEAGQTAQVEATLRPVGGRGLPPDQPEPGPERPGGTSRALFWTSLVATGAGVTAFTITGLQVRGSLEDAKLEAIADLEEQEGVRLDSENACADAEDNHAGSPGAQRVVDACDKGRSRATLTNVFIGATVVTALAASYFYYRGYVAADPAPSREGTRAAAARRRRATQVRFTPAVGPEVVGAGFEIKF